MNPIPESVSTKSETQRVKWDRQGEGGRAERVREGPLEAGMQAGLRSFHRQQEQEQEEGRSRSGEEQVQRV